MLDISEILDNLRLNISLSENQKKKILQSRLNDRSVIEYLKNKLSNLTIKINNDDCYPVFDLMENGKLLKTCFQTSETISIFLNDDDYVERGNITSGGIIDGHSYDHSWVCFKYNDVEYVLDACLNILCTKEDYYLAFKPRYCARVDAKAIKEELIRQLTLPRDNDDDGYDENGIKYDIGMFENGCTCLISKRRDEINIEGSENRQSPLYGNWSSYIASIDDNKIKKLVFHHYKNPCGE